MHRFISRFHSIILIFAALLTIPAIILTTQIKLNVNLFSLLPSESPIAQTFFEITEEIGFQSLLISMVELPTTIEQGEAETLIDLLAINYSKSDLIDKVEYKGDEEQMALLYEEIVPFFPLLLKEPELKKLTQKLSDSEIKSRVQENKRFLAAPFSMAAKTLILKDPLGIRDLIGVKGSVSFDEQGIRSFQGYFRTQGNIYLLFIRPKEPPQDLSFSRKLMQEVHRLEKITLSTFNEERQDFSEEIKISYTGGYPIAVNDEATTKRDIKVTLLTSFLGVMIIFGLSFRNPRIIVYVAVPLGISLIWALGFSKLAFPSLNILTFIFSCVLIGLGIDFAIHIVNRYFDPNRVGLNAIQRLRQTYQEAGMGVVIGGVTTAAAFYSISISDFSGFNELGILTGTGIIICLLVMFFVLPSLLFRFSGTNLSRKKAVIAGFGLESLMKSIQKYPKLYLMTSFIVVLCLVILGLKIGFDDNLRNFRSADNRVLQLQDQVTQWMGSSTAQILLVTHEPSEEEVMEISTTIYDALKGLETSDTISDVRSISQYLPSPRRQEESLYFIQRHPEVFDIRRVKGAFVEALEEYGFESSNVYDEYLDGLAKAFSVEHVLLPSELSRMGLAEALKPFFYERSREYKTITYITPSKDLWSREDISEFKEGIVNKLEENGIGRERYELTGPIMLTDDLKALILENLKASMLLAGLSILLVLLISYRNIKLFVLSIIPLLIGLGILAGVMVILGLDFNFFNLIVLPMIVGIGIDDGVHLTNMFRDKGGIIALEGMMETGRAVILTSLTTMVGFGSIALSHYPGLKSMGYVALIGISACLFASLIILPAIFTLLSPSK